MNDIIPIPGFADPFSSLSHLLGAGVFAVLSIPLLWRARHDRSALISEAVFCFGVVFLLSMSGVYHLIDDGTAKDVMRRLDHAAIFVLIAASFTPAHIILFRGWKRWAILALVWTFAIVAISLKMVYFEEIHKAIGISLYLIMGWIGIGTGILLWRHHGFRFMLPILLGGIAYSVGAMLQGLQWPVIIPGVLQWHELFHVLVLVGLGFHWAFNYRIADGMDYEPTQSLEPKRLAA